jgi:hypothetical protein
MDSRLRGNDEVFAEFARTHFVTHKKVGTTPISIVVGRGHRSRRYLHRWRAHLPVFTMLFSSAFALLA